jgi:hypothetical protein
MRKVTLVLILSTVTMMILIAPFCLPNEWIYIEYNRPVYHPLAETLMSVSLFILALFASYGITSAFDEILNN